MTENIFEPANGGVYGNAPAATETVIAATTEVPTEKPAGEVVVEKVDEVPAIPSFEDILKEKTGGKFTKWDEVEPLLNAPAPTAAEIKYANEQSKKVHELIVAGKLDEVIDTFNHQRVLGNVKDLDDASAIKLAMKYKDSALTDADIEAELSDRLQVEAPEKPSEDDYITDEDFAKANKAYEKELSAFEKQKRAAEREIKKEAKDARTYLESLKADIVLPDLPALPGVPAAQQMDPVEAAKIQKQIQDSFEAAITNVKSHNLKYSEDGVELELGYEIPETAIDDMMDRFSKEEFSEILAKRYVKGDGSLDATKLMQELHLLENFESIQKSNIKQALAKAKLDVLKDVKNVDLEQKSREVVQTSDLERKNQFAAKVFAS